MSVGGCKAQSIAMAGIVALALVAAAPADEQLGQKSAYLRITVSEKSVVYLQAQGLELRAAMSVEGLQSAEPMKMRVFGGTAAQAREFALPIPADQLPAGITAVKAGPVAAPGAAESDKPARTLFFRQTHALPDR